MSEGMPEIRAYKDRPFIPAVRVGDIVGEAGQYARAHLRHSRREKEICGCGRHEKLGSGVPETDQDLTAVGREQYGPAGFALADGTWVQYGAGPDDTWGAVRHEVPGDRQSRRIWLQSAHGRPMALTGSGAWRIESDETEARRLLSHHWPPVEGAFPGSLMLSTEVLGHVFTLLGDHRTTAGNRYITQVDGRMVSDGSVSRGDALAAAEQELARILGAAAGRPGARSSCG